MTANHSVQIQDQYEQHFVQFLNWYEDADYLYFAMEFMACGDLQQFTLTAI